jgi:integrase
MIYKPENGRFYFAKFRWQGKLIRRSTRATDSKTAHAIEGRIRSELARGNWGILDERKAIPTLAEFLRKDFLPFIEGKCKAKPNTLAYWGYGARDLLASDFARLPLNKITDQHAGQFAARHSHQSPSTVNRGLRTLQRAFSLACDWGRIDRKPKIGLADGERRRERVLTDGEAERYLAVSAQPWRDVATIMLGTGARPGELFTLRWENVLLNGHGGMIQILAGKTKSARRILPMVPRVYETFKTRHEGAGRPTEGWVFPTSSKFGHLEEGGAHFQHGKALGASGVSVFPPYTLRHTALTNLARLGTDAFTLAKIAGHSRVSITERYIHPAEDTIQRAFERMAGNQKVVTDGGHR